MVDKDFQDRASFPGHKNTPVFNHESCRTYRAEPGLNSNCR